MNRPNTLHEIIADEISAIGPMPFRRFMDLCLYHPGFGYYEQSEKVVGKAGDFYTSVSVGAAFGRLLAQQFLKWAAEAFGRAFAIVETGAHDAQLCRDILHSVTGSRSSAVESIGYMIVEPSSRRREWQRRTLGSLAERVRWVRCLDEIPARSVDGVMFSNELLDAMPVCRLVWNVSSKEWRESCVTLGKDGFVWAEREPDRGVVRGINRLFFESDLVPEALAAVLPDGYVVEFSADAGGWWRKAAERLRDGRLMMFDYGMEAAELLRPERREGTLRACSKHRSSAGVLENPGRQDLTAHVNLTQLIRVGEAAGLRTETLTTQSRFLTGLLSNLDATSLSGKELRQIRTLVHPEHLGSAFKVLVQRTE